MIAIIDYGLGNVGAFYNMYRAMNIEAKIVKTAAELEGATKLILPGVGSFDLAMSLFKSSCMFSSVSESVLKKKTPVLGICVGMQMLADSSEEGESQGLGWISGEVKKIDSTNLTHQTKLPHMGWNDVAPKDHPLFTGLNAGKFYFLHSYYFDAKTENDVLALVDYGDRFPCSVGKENIYGVQFHPEKSHHYGAQLLKNFANLPC